MTSRAEVLDRIAREIVSIRPERYTMSAAEIAESVKTWKEPSKAQIEAENYRKPRLSLYGLSVAIENPRGTRRKPEWPPLAHHYGHLSRVAGRPAPEGHDDEAIDCVVGPHPESEIIFVVDQEHPSGRYDECKVLFGFRNMKEARQGYLDNYPSDWHCGPITALTTDQFRAWLEDGNPKQRIAEQVSRYGAKYAFDDLHPRAEDNKRFVDKHKSVTLAQTLRHPATSGERSHYKKYADFVKVGGTKPLPFKDWLTFHRTAKYHKAQKEREDVAKTSPGGRDSEGIEKDQAADARSGQNVDQGSRKGPRNSGAVGPGSEAEQLIGGKADNRSERTFDPNELSKGRKVESEHTDNPAVAEEITSDHLAEDPRYYDKLLQMEAGNADSDESETVDQDEDTDEDSQQERSEDSTEFTPSRPSRSVGSPSKHSLKAIHSFAASMYANYYQDQGK